MIRNTKGFYTLEAAIFLPIFIIAILTIGYFIKVAGATEDVMHAAVDESRLAASHSYNIKVNPGFTSKLENRISKENSDVSYIDVNRFRYLHERNGNKGMISFNLDYRVDIHLPLKMQSGISKSDRVLCRGWIGRTLEGKPMSFEDMMTNDGGGTVWVFPASGKRYHKHNCTFVTNYPVQTIFNDSVKKHYKACENCHPGDLATGSLVYCFPKYGDAYHRGGCSTIEKYTVTLSKNQAEERGYTPCGKCGGI